MYVGTGVDDYALLSIAHNATVRFINNVALYGGAIYVDQDYCFVDENYHNGSIVFVNNGPPIYSSYNWCSYSTSTDSCVVIQDTTSIVSLPTIMSFNSDNKTSVFPGQTITGDMTVIDCFGNVSSCLADANLSCHGEVCSDYKLQGSSTVFLSHGSMVNTGLRIINTTNLRNSMHKLKLHFHCRSPIRELLQTLTVDVTVLLCPLGFVYRNDTGQCECGHNAGSEYFVCSSGAGGACVKKGYWYSEGTVSQCVHLFCNYSGPACPSSVSPGALNYVLLGSYQDDQCLNGHGSTLCTGCVHNKLPTYGALQCIDSDKCAKWHPYILLFLNILIPFIYGAFLMIAVRLKLSIGSGYLYGPLFYLAVLNLMPFSSHATLNTIVSSFIATFLLQFQILGYIPWCFFDTVSLLTSKWFELIAPSVVAVVLLLTVYLARRSPKLVGRIQQSPLQAMCLLMFVLFWSLASTAISVITPVYLSGVEGARVHLQPDLPYLSGGHIPLWIISVIILLVLYSIVFVLTFSRFLNLHRLKPVLDEFQSCYRDSYRWCGGVYFIIWTILQTLILTSSYQLFHTSVIVLTVTHCLLQPYCKKWLNVMDGFLLGSLSITLTFILDDITTHVSEVLVYMSVMVPICLLSLGVVSIVMVRFNMMSKLKAYYSTKIRKCFALVNKKIHSNSTRQPQNVVTRSTVTINASNLSQPSSDDSHYREPLLLHLQESASYNATDSSN